MPLTHIKESHFILIILVQPVFGISPPKECTIMRRVRYCTKLCCVFLGFGESKLGAKIDPKSIKKGGQHGKASWHRFLIDFDGLGQPSCPKKSTQDRFCWPGLASWRVLWASRAVLEASSSRLGAFWSVWAQFQVGKCGKNRNRSNRKEKVPVQT